MLRDIQCFQLLIDDRKQRQCRNAQLMQRSATGNRRSTVIRSTPGMEATLSLRFFPSWMKHGINQVIRCQYGSRIKRRENSLRRMRRIRTAGKEP